MAPKVVLISLDGATDSIVDKYLASGVLDAKTGLGLLKAKGVAATDNETITPSITAPSHIAIATGSTAVNNDINNNTFSLVANPFTFNTSGFAAPIGGYTYQFGIDPAETNTPSATPIWQTLQAAGKSVVSATFPGADGVNILSSTSTSTGKAVILDKAADRTVSYTVPFGAFGGVGGTGFSLTAADFSVSNTQAVTGLTALGRTSYSAVKVANLETIAGTALTGGSTKTNYVMQVAAIDTTNDNVVNYDTLVVFDANVGIQAAATLPATGSAFIKVSDQKSSKFFFDGSNNKVGTAFFAGNVASDLSTVNIARYSGAYIPRPAESPGVIANVDDIVNNIGNWAPQADFRFPERINPGLAKFSDAELEALYEDQVKTFVDYQTNVLLRSIKQNPNADLVLGYIEQPDGSAHQFLLTDPRQASDFTNPNSIGTGQDAAKVARYAKYVEVAYQAANTAVQKVIEAVGVDASGKPNSDIIVTSDHGFAPFHTAVNINNLLTNAGIVNSKVRAVVSGPAVNIYINLEGREAAVAGVTQVKVPEYLTLQKQVIDLLKGFVDTNANYTNGAASVGVFDKVYNRDATGATTANDVINARGTFIGQDTGDVFALLKTGYNFDGTQTPAPVIRKGDTAATAATAVLSVPNFYGAHGYDPTLPEMKAIFYAAGPDIVSQPLGSVRNIDIAPTIEKILNVTPAATVNGKAIAVTNPFPSGVASGDTTQTSTVLWTRSQTPGTVKFEYSTKADFSTIVGTKTATVASALQPVKVDVTGLTAGTDYFYRAVDATGATATGKFSTAAALGQLTGLKFGVSGDWRGELAPYPAISNADDAKLKFFVEFGDTIYADVASPAVKNPDGTEKKQSTTLADYRAKQSEVYDSRYGLNTLADLRASTSILATIDDHEVTNDFAGGQDLAKSTAAQQALYGATTGLVNDSPLFENGLQAFQEFNPIRDLTYNTPSDAVVNGERKIYRYNTFGKDAATFVLDARSFRSTELAAVTNTNDATQVGTFLANSFDPTRTMLGKQQVQDLKTDLLNAQSNGTTWKFIMVPEPIENIGILAASDRFEGYAAERTEILKFVNDNNISNVVFVSADFHGTLVNNLTYQNAPGQAQIATSAFEIITGSVAYDKPFGPTVAELATQVGLLTAAQKAQYDALPNAGKDAFIKNIVDGGLAPLGYDPVGLDKNLAQANGLINAKLLQGDYIATNTYGWTEFNIDKDTQKLTVTTYGIDAYSRAQLEANPTAITSRVPTIVSQFEVVPNSFAAEPVAGGAGDDTSIVPTFKQVVFTDGGNDLVDGSVSKGSDNRVYGGEGNDELYAGLRDRLFGENGDDILDATAGKGGNRLYGGAGNDSLFAGTNDFLSGGDGDDKLFAGKGGNTLFGGAGADKFYLTSGGLPTSANTVGDFEVGTDKLLILGVSGVTGFSNVTLTQQGADALVKAGGKDLALLTGIQSSTLTASSFAFA
jgi:phosphodiesterase/alkaline phosphatase D-like protein/predicted AlkP superfamily pyrophosphatase or phosphodiesterase